MMSHFLLPDYLAQEGSASNSPSLPPLNPTLAPSSRQDQPSAMDMNRLIMNYLVTEGFKEAAEKFMVEAKINPTMPLDSLDPRIMIRDAIQNGEIAKAIKMVHEMYPELLDDERYLFFHLQQQQLIEMIRRGQVEEAINFASNNLAERGEENPLVLEELERTMALLAFEDPTNSPFSDLLSLSHRQKVASELNAALLNAEHAECVQPKLAGLIKLLLWSQSELEKKGIRFTKMVDLQSFAKRPPK